VKKWWQSKTVWTGIGGFLIAVGSYLTGQMGLADAIQTGLISLLAIWIRDGIGLAK